MSFCGWEEGKERGRASGLGWEGVGRVGGREGGRTKGWVGVRDEQEESNGQVRHEEVRRGKNQLKRLQMVSSIVHLPLLPPNADQI